jgi:hypothetical protein
VNKDEVAELMGLVCIEPCEQADVLYLFEAGSSHVLLELVGQQSVRSMNKSLTSPSGMSSSPSISMYRRVLSISVS